MKTKNRTAALVAAAMALAPASMSAQSADHFLKVEVCNYYKHRPDGNEIHGVPVDKSRAITVPAKGVCTICAEW